MTEISIRYCPHCGKKTFTQSALNRVYCTACPFELYLNTATAVCAIIVNGEGNLLVTRRANDPQKGAWDLPGGFVDPGETAEQALAREIKEELGLKLISARYLGSEPNIYPYKGRCYRTVDLAFACTVDNPDYARPFDDVAGLLFADPQTLDLSQFGFDSIRRICENYFGIDPSQ
jgi:NAD+ diphosphatase